MYIDSLWNEDSRCVDHFASGSEFDSPLESADDRWEKSQRFVSETEEK